LRNEFEPNELTIRTSKKFCRNDPKKLDSFLQIFEDYLEYKKENAEILLQKIKILNVAQEILQVFG